MMMPTQKGLLTSEDKKYHRTASICREAYDEAGLTSDEGQRLNENPKFKKELVELFKKCSAKASNYSVARMILGKDFISPEEIVKARNCVAYTDKQLGVRKDITFTESA